MMMQENGCILDLSGASSDIGRRLQGYLSQRLSSSDPACNWDDMDNYAIDVDRWAAPPLFLLVVLIFI